MRVGTQKIMDEDRFLGSQKSRKDFERSSVCKLVNKMELQMCTGSQNRGKKRFMISINDEPCHFLGCTGDWTFSAEVSCQPHAQ